MNGEIGSRACMLLTEVMKTLRRDKQIAVVRGSRKWGELKTVCPVEAWETDTTMARDTRREDTFPACIARGGFRTLLL